MTEIKSTPNKRITPLPSWQTAVGSTLIVAGLLALADPYLWPGHLRLFSLPVAGILLSGWALWIRRATLWITGIFLIGAGIAWLVVFLLPPASSPPQKIVSALIIGIVASCLIIATLTPWFFSQSAEWALIPIVPGAAAAYVLLNTPTRLSDYVFLALIAMGTVFTAIGIRKHLIGWLIPGGLLLGLGPGFSALIQRLSSTQIAAAIGLFLLWFALGWMLITLTSRVIMHRIIWWPLIPAGVLGVAGLALYIADNPAATPTLLSNTGSITMIVFGLYLLLMRYGVRR
ncbi:hypothetical protein [uncultured Thermanaerothrix sp.]|uniref:hypothetical protein n=1 Tax=uncultured Thermanaerothrix sp. TaxID=1195149 RepID=UPI002602E3DC|nr:hypothetical protein [uncultured Thermanaerothrix sp.]